MMQQFSVFIDTFAGKYLFYCIADMLFSVEAGMLNFLTLLLLLINFSC